MPIAPQSPLVDPIEGGGFGSPANSSPVGFGTRPEMWNMLPAPATELPKFDLSRWVRNDVPVGDVDGVNTLFQASWKIQNGTELCFLNGVLYPDGYTIENLDVAVITFNLPGVPNGAPPAGTVINFAYWTD